MGLGGTGRDWVDLTQTHFKYSKTSFEKNCFSAWASTLNMGLINIGESGRKLGDRFREHLLDVKNKGSDLSKPVARHFNLPGHSHEHMEICGIYLHLGNNETRKRKEQRLIFKLGTLAPNGINERFSFA